jgi:hypothetical protein
MSDTDTPRRIDLAGGDYAIPDSDYCQQELDGCTTRTAQKYDAEGLPYIKFRGRKYRPVLAGREWKKQQIVTRKSERTARRAVERRRGRMQSA